MARITKRLVDVLEPKERQFTVYDDTLKGFGVRVMPSGVASYIIEYRPDGGGRGVWTKRMAIGRVGEITPDQARELAKDCLTEVRRGTDPLAERQTRRKEPTVSEMIELWSSENPVGRRGMPLADRTRTYMLGRLRAHVVPLIGSKKISSVSTLDVNTMVRRIVKGETRCDGESGKSRGRYRIRGGDAAARRTVSDLAAIFSFAIDRGIVKINPVTGAKKPSARQRRDFLRVEEIGKIAAALDQMEREGVNQAGISILRLLMVTGARPSEIEGLRWSEVDLEARCLRLANTKTGHSVRPLPTVAIAIIAQQPTAGSSPYVFPATRGTGYFTGSKQIWTRARTRAGLPNKVRYHARHAVATLSLAGGADIVSVSHLLGHANPRTTLMTYTHVTDKASEAAESIGNVVDAAMKRRPSAVVIPLKESR